MSAALELCGAKKRQGEGTCRLRAGLGTDHVGWGRCKFHGGATRTVRLGAAKQEAQARAVVMGAPVDIEPHDALLMCVRAAAGEVQYASEQVAALEAGEVVGAPVTVKERPDGSVETTRHTPELHVWVRARQDALDRLARVSKQAVDAGVAERQVQVAEMLGNQLADAMRGLVGDLAGAWGISRPFERSEVRAIVTRHLTLLTSGAGGAPVDGGVA
jgi:hypothetical protein